MNITLENCIKRLEEIIKNSTSYDYCEFEVESKKWTGYGKDRTYLSIVEKSKDYKTSKHYKKKRLWILR